MKISALVRVVCYKKDAHLFDFLNLKTPDNFDQRNSKPRPGEEKMHVVSGYVEVDHPSWEWRTLTSKVMVPHYGTSTIGFDDGTISFAHDGQNYVYNTGMSDPINNPDKCALVYSMKKSIRSNAGVAQW